MTQWGIALLCAFIFLGVCRTTWRKAGYLALIVTGGVIAAVMVNNKMTAPSLPTPAAVEVTGSSVLPRVNVTGRPYIGPGEDKTGRDLATQRLSKPTTVPS